MSARRKHVRSHVHDVDVEIVSEEGDAVCRVEEVKGGNMIEVCMRFFFLLLVVVCGARRGATFISSFARCFVPRSSLTILCLLLPFFCVR